MPAFQSIGDCHGSKLMKNPSPRFMKTLSFLLSVIVTISATSITLPQSSADYDVVITNGRIVDGTGNPWFRADIGIRDGRIVTVGRISPGTAKQTIDAHDQIVAPGFIDVHT